MNFDESYQFGNLDELRNFLNQFKETDLSTIWPDESSEYLNLRLKERELSDGSKVTDFTFKMV